MAKNIKTITEEIAAPIIENMGYIYMGTDFSKQGKDHILTVFIDKKGGVTLDDCEAVSRVIEPLIDEADPIEQTYYLSVSSPGLDRPLKTPKDYEAALESVIDVKLYKPFLDKKEFTGTLTKFDDETFTIETDEDEITFSYPEAAKVSLHLDF